MSDASFAELEPGTFVRLSGLTFDDEPSDWHLNDAVRTAIEIENAGDGLIFQRAAGHREWLTVITEGGTPVEIQLVDSVGGSEAVGDVDEIEIVATAESAGDLDA